MGTTASLAEEVDALLRRLTLAVVLSVPLEGAVLPLLVLPLPELPPLLEPPLELPPLLEPPVPGTALPEASAKSTGWLSGPAEPSGSRPFLRWNCFMASLVFSP